MMKGNTRIIMIFMAFAVICSFHACKKSDNDHIYNLKVNCKTTSLYCYPEGRILWSFLVNVENGVPPYNFNWISPETTSTGDTFTLDITKNSVIRLEIEDAGKNRGKLSLEVKQDTIDSLKYDYRNQFIGEYMGTTTDSYYDWHTMPAPEYTSTIDTFTILKAEKFSQVMLSSWNLDFDFNTRAFSYLSPSLSNATLHNDTLYFYSHPGLYDSHSFTGIKIEE
jgi:hypothetical protein